MKVSVIIPVYNMAPFVEECIRSVQCQTLQDLEIILVDDGSTDDSRRIIARCMDCDPRIRYFYQENQGAGPARNLGIENARGEFLAFLDSDDLFFDADALGRMVDACEKNHTAICASYRNEFKNGQFRPADLFKQLGHIPPEGRRVGFSEHQNDFFYQSYLYRRDLIEANHLRFPHYRRYEDPPFLLRALDLAETFWLVPVTLHCYRKGHQIWSKNGIHVADSLSGLRDNLLLAEKKYPLLYQELISRIDRMYRGDILNNPSSRLNRVLLEINEIYKRNDPRNRNLPLLEELFPGSPLT